MSMSSSKNTTQNVWSGVTPPESAGTRLDAFVAAQLQEQGLSREAVKNWIKQGNLLLDGSECRKPNTRLSGGERLELRWELQGTTLAPETGTLDIVYKDRHVLVLDKPAGLTVHPAPGLPEGTLVHRLLHRFPEIGDMPGLRPGIVHRIDKDTSGLLLIALDEPTRQKMSQAFAARQVEKEYLALVAGVPAPPEGTLVQPIGRHPTHKVKMAVVAKGGKPARSDYRVLHIGADNRFSLLAVRIHTGRTHQIRVHLSHAKHPILGDHTYGGAMATNTPPATPLPCSKLAQRQMLHAWRLGFEHPESGERLDFLRPPPSDFKRLALCLSRTLQRVVVTGMPGSGKSTLARLLHEAGVPLFSADAEVGRLYAPGADGWHFIKSRFGEEFLIAPDFPQTHGHADQRQVDRKALFTAMQERDEVRREINAALHPMVRHRMAEFWKAHANCRFAVAEVPLFLEAGGNWRESMSDIVVGVRCSQEMRLRRLQENRGWDARTVASFDAWQWPEDKKLGACDLVVDNDAGLHELQHRARELLNTLKTKRRHHMRTLAAKLEALFQKEKEK